LWALLRILKTLPLKYGIFTGSAAVSWKLAEYYLNLNVNTIGAWAGFIPYFVLLIGVFIGILTQRLNKKSGAGLLDFKQGARTGVVISLVTGIILAIFGFVYCRFINPEFLEQYLAMTKDLMLKDKQPAEIIEKEMQMIKDSASLGRLMFRSFTTSLFIGMLGSFIFAAILKKEAKETAD